MNPLKGGLDRAGFTSWIAAPMVLYFIAFLMAINDSPGGTIYSAVFYAFLLLASFLWIVITIRRFEDIGIRSWQLIPAFALIFVPFVYLVLFFIPSNTIKHRV
jgi:uncharacterized membrane protein YhaH (DUF805 family)